MKDKILKWCGFEYDTTQTRGYVHDFGWRDPDGHCIISLEWDEAPILDINFFFEYVVPRLHSVDVFCFEDEYIIQLVEIVSVNGVMQNNTYSERSNDPNLAWQEALIKLIEEE